MKKKYTITLLIFLSIFLISNIFSSWIVSFPIEGETKFTTDSELPVAYIERNDEVVGEYISIESALLEAKNGDIVNVYLDEDTKGAKTITRNCVIKEGVTLNVANQFAEDSSNLVDLQKDMNANDNIDSSLAEKNTNKLTNTVIINNDVLVTNKGIIIIGGILSGGAGSSAYCGQTSGDYGKIQLGNNAKIISYGEIRCCGYITESSSNNGSSVEIKEGSLKIPFIVRDFCGGTDTYAIYSKRDSYYISPFNQFELRNIQCEYKIYYYGCMYGCSNISLEGKTYFNEIKFIENSSNSFFELDNTNGYASIKYNKDKEIMDFNFYGDATINSITLNLKIKNLISVNIDLNDYYFPISWRVDISFNALDEQKNNDELAVFSAGKQKIKLMPGAKLTVEEGVSFIVPAMNVYTYYFDCRNGIGGKKYNTGYTDKEIISPAEFYVNGKFTCTGNFGGRIIKGENADLSENENIENKKNTTYEVYDKKESLSIRKYTLYSLDNVLAIDEKATIIKKSEFDNYKTLAVGVVKFKDGVTPSYSITANGSTDDLSGNYIYSIPATSNSFIPCFKSNISTAYFNDNTTDLCQSGETKELTKNINTLIINGSSSEISKTVTISGDKSLIFVNESLQLTATTSSSTANSIIWSSSDESIATVDKDTGIVTGISDGTATIFARIDGEFTGDSYNISVTSDFGPDITKVYFTIDGQEVENDNSVADNAYEKTIKAVIEPSEYNSDRYEFQWFVYEGDSKKENITSNASGCSAKSSLKDHHLSVNVYIPKHKRWFQTKNYTLMLIIKDKKDNTLDYKYFVITMHAKYA